MRYLEEKIMKLFMSLSLVVVVGSFFLIVGTIFGKGWAGLSWAMVTETPSGGFYIGKGGGVLNAIAGSLYISLGASLLSLLISLPVVVYINVYLKKSSWFGAVARLSSDVLFGIPSIVYGAFGFTLMILMGMKASLLGGIITATLLVIPIMIRTTDEVMRTVPKELLDASYSLGATQLEAAKVLLKQVRPGILTAFLLSFARVIGDAATVMFTAGFSDNIPRTLDSPAATLPLSIFFQLSSPIPEVQNKAYSAAFILTLLVLAISLVSRALSKRLSKNKI